VNSDQQHRLRDFRRNLRPLSVLLSNEITADGTATTATLIKIAPDLIVQCDALAAEAEKILREGRMPDSGKWYELLGRSRALHANFEELGANVSQ
jgi:hypothetical protein